MIGEGDKAQGVVEWKPYYTPMPNNLFFVGAFPDLTPSAVLGLQRHFFLAMQAARRKFGERPKIPQAWSVTYEAPSKKIGPSRVATERTNSNLTRCDYVEFVGRSPRSVHAIKVAVRGRVVPRIVRSGWRGCCSEGR